MSLQVDCSTTHAGVPPRGVPRVVLSTAANREEALRIAHALVETRLAACVNIIEGVHSVYRWKEKMEEADEVMLLIKTTEDQLVAVEQALQTLNSYEVPEVLVLPVAGGSHSYFEWLQTSVR